MPLSRRGGRALVAGVTLGALAGGCTALLGIEDLPTPGGPGEGALDGGSVDSSLVASGADATFDRGSPAGDAEGDPRDAASDAPAPPLRDACVSAPCVATDPGGEECIDHGCSAGLMCVNWVCHPACAEAGGGCVIGGRAGTCADLGPGAARDAAPLLACASDCDLAAPAPCGPLDAAALPGWGPYACELVQPRATDCVVANTGDFQRGCPPGSTPFGGVNQCARFCHLDGGSSPCPTGTTCTVPPLFDVVTPSGTYGVCQ